MEILFKAKRADGKGWQSGKNITRLIHENVERVFIANSFWFNESDLIHAIEWIEVIPETVCLFWKEHKKAGKLFSGDKVKVQGTKRVGVYETEIVFDGTMFKLKSNKTNFIDSATFVAILEFTGNIYDDGK
jgi:hypothetical protein